MATERSVYRDTRYPTPVDFERLWSPVGLPAVYIAPSDHPDLECEVGGGEDFARVSRADLLEWAEAIVHAIQTS